jgi:hypothetical protein
MTEIVMTVVAMMGVLLKRPTVTITGQKRNLILLNHLKCNRYRPYWVRAKSELLSGIG